MKNLKDRIMTISESSSYDDVVAIPFKGANGSEVVMLMPSSYCNIAWEFGESISMKEVNNILSYCDSNNNKYNMKDMLCDHSYMEVVDCTSWDWSQYSDDDDYRTSYEN